MKAASAAQMREMDRQTIEDYGVPSIVLMENAALRVAETMAERYSPLAGRKIAVVCGKGNNGGDGLAVARHLATRFGAEVAVWLAADPATLAGDARVSYEMARKFGLDIQPVSDLSVFGASLAQADVIVDALLGTGVTGAVTGMMAQVIDAVNKSGRSVIAIDLPSGLSADTGEVEGGGVRATLTVTLALPKFGLVVYPGTEYVGEMVVADIGMPRQVMQAEAVRVSVTDVADVAAWLPSRTENRDSNKGKFGHAVVFAGSRGLIGASVLASEAAARTGAGLVTLAVPQSVQDVVMSRVSPVVMTRGLPETGQGTFAKEAVEAALELAGKGSAAALGPGLGGTESDETRAFVREFVARCPVPLVLDADALNILSLEPDYGAALVKGRSSPTVLTPHPGEMGRLLGTDAKEVQAKRRASVERAAELFGCVVLLKGSRTLIAGPDGALAINTTGNSGMATGGAGDTLTGIITALIASRLGPLEAAVAGAYLHGLAGDLVAQDHGGKAGLVATDLIDALPHALGQCEKGNH